MKINKSIVGKKIYEFNEKRRLTKVHDNVTHIDEFIKIPIINGGYSLCMKKERYYQLGK